MSGVKVSGGIKQGSLSMVVLNADGTVKADLGMVGYYHRNPLIRWIKGTWVSYLGSRRINKLNGNKCTD